MHKYHQNYGDYGLKRGDHGLKVYIMCEIPSNVICAEEFCELVDGFSIGSNDLTQLTLGLDRDSELVSHLYDKQYCSQTHDKNVITTCKQKNESWNFGQDQATQKNFVNFYYNVKSTLFHSHQIVSLKQY